MGHDIGKFNVIPINKNSFPTKETYQFVSTSSLEIIVWNLKKDYSISKKADLERLEDTKEEPILRACLSSHNKQMLITVQRLKIKFWNLTNGLLIKLINTSPHKGSVKGIMQINSENLIVFYDLEPYMEIYDVNKNVLVMSIDGGKYDILSMASCILSYNPNEILIGSSSFSTSKETDRYQLRLWRWDFNRSLCVKTFKQTRQVWNLILLPPCIENNNIQSFAHTSGGWINVWNIENVNECMYSFEAHSKDITGLSLISKTNQLLSFVDNEIKVWSLSKQFKYEFLWTKRVVYVENIFRIRNVPAENIILIGTKQGRFYLFDLMRKELVTKNECGDCRHDYGREWERSVYFLDFF